MDYDDRLHRVYAEGRRLTPAGMRRWLDEFERWAPPERPLRVLDLGSGTGRFTPALADTFGGPVYGVEPSARMRDIAQVDAAHPEVIYLDGAAEAIPLADGSCDLALLFLTFHHFRDRAAALAELVRVLRPGGVALMRSQFRDRMPDLYWYRYFPSARRVDAEMYPSLAEVRELASAAGLVPDPGTGGPAGDGHAGPARDVRAAEQASLLDVRAHPGRRTGRRLRGLPPGRRSAAGPADTGGAHGSSRPPQAGRRPWPLTELVSPIRTIR